MYLQNVPVEAVRKGNRLIGKAVDLAHMDALAVEAPQHRAATLRAEVNREHA
jgi:hypothetical protein